MLSFLRLRSLQMLVAMIVLNTLIKSPLEAQVPTANASPAMLRTEYLNDMKDVEEKVLALAEMFPQEKYFWRPGAGVRSVSEALMHVAAEHYFYIPAGLGLKPPSDLNMGATGKEINVNLEKVTNKAEVIGHLKKAFAFQRSLLMGADDKIKSGRVTSFGEEQSVAKFFNVFIADQHEHLGQLIAYARVNGLVPPWSVKK